MMEGSLASEADDDIESPTFKRSKLTGAATYGTKYNPAWSSEFPFISEGHQDPDRSFFCKVCHKDISCSHQGIADIRRHEKTKAHVNSVSAVTKNARLSDMGFIPVGSSIDKQVNRFWAVRLLE